MRTLPLLLLLPTLALAQTNQIREPPVPPRGVALPPTSPAIVDEATALAVNPAALRFVGPGQLFYVYERNTVQDQVGNGLFLGTTALDSLGAGVALQWVRGRGGQPDYQKTTFGLSLGSPVLALGGSWHLYSSEARGLDRLSSFDLGLAFRPARSLALGAVLKDVGAPAVEGLSVPRRLEVAVGVRPFEERLTLSASYGFTGGDWGRGQLTWTVLGRPLPGLGLGAGLSHGFTGEPLALQASLTFDSSLFGVTYAGGGSQDRLDHIVAARLSSQPYPAIVDPGVIALIDLDDRLVSRVSPVLAVLGASGPDPLLQLLEDLELAAREPQLKGVLLKIQNLPGVDWGQAEELRQAVLKLRKAGKRVLAVLYSVDDRAYMVGAAADEVYAVSGGSLQLNGLAANLTYFGGTMEKLGVQWDVARVGEYKTAPERLTRRDMSPAEREAVEGYLDTQADHYAAAVAEARRMPVEQVKATWEEGLLTPALAQQRGLVDGVLETSEALSKKLESLVPGARYEATWSPRQEREGRWGRRRRIAVVPVIGSIAGGRSRESPLGTEQVAGAETVIRALAQARGDPSVVAIVLRVDSGGGEVLASELMYRAVLEAKKDKPVVASMGGVAASGGYYVAMGADEIYALPTTITGSIGVFYLKPALQGLGEKLGVNQETVLRGPKADLLGLWRPWTQEEQAVVQRWVDAAYDDFITRVAAERELAKERVDAVARGRVWSGQAAKERGLVDELGGLMAAVASARKRAGVAPEEELELVVVGEARGLLSAPGGEPGVGLARGGQALPPAWRQAARELGLDSPAVLEPGLKAMLPFTLTVR